MRGMGRSELPARPLSWERDWQTLRTLLPYLWPSQRPADRVRVVVAGLMLIAAKGATVSIPILLKHAVDALTTDAVLVPVWVILAYGGVRVAATTFQQIRDVVFSHVWHRAIRAVALETFSHLHTLALRYHLDRQTGGLSRAIERGTASIETILRFLLFSIVPTLLEIGMVTLVLWSLYDWTYALTTLTAVGSYVAFTMVVTDWRTKFRREMNRADSQAMSKAVDSLLNYETVKYFGNEDHEAQRFDRFLEQYQTASLQSRSSLALLNTGQAAIIGLGVTVVMLLAARGVSAGSMSVGDFVLVNTFLLQLYIPLNFLGGIYRQLKQSLTDLEAMFAILEEPAEIADRPGAPPLVVTEGRLVFERVRFSYTPDRPILDDISFEIPPGHRVAIVGVTGSGKSTLGRLLFRFYDVDGGRITIDGQDIRHVTQHSLRAAIGIVPQDTVLFNDSIGYNIAYGRPGATEADIEAAARRAEIATFVAGLPQGYATLVGERGLKLSGGEKQRVAIARTLLKGPRIFLFDEATSALDNHTERDIQAHLRTVSAGRTTLVIAHRLSTIVDADNILVVENGRIVESGRHEALLARQGRYAAMWQRQLDTAGEGAGEAAGEGKA